MGRSAFAFASVFLTCYCLMPGDAIAQSANDRPTSRPRVVLGREVAHWTGLPIWGDEAREKGFDMPLPLGISGTFYTDKQEFRAESLKLGLIGGGLVDVGSVIQVTNVKVEQTAWTARLDAWVLPFLSVYGIAGYVTGEADIGLGIPTIPLVGVPLAEFNLNLQFDGPIVGVGTTLAGGFMPIKGRSTILFASADLNFTKTFLDFDKLGVSLDTGVGTVVFSTRLGVRDRILRDSSLGDLHVSVWGGAMYQGVQRVLSGRVETLGLAFRLDPEARAPWNAVFGGRMEIGENIDVMVEAGIGGRRALLLSATFRF